MLNQVINGYKIEKFLGKGGFGEVYLATKEGRNYAIKFIKKDFIYKNLQDKRLHREIAALRNVKGDYTVEFFEDGEYTENFTEYKYIVMELFDGSSLREVLVTRGKIGDESEALNLIIEILKGLRDIHKAGIIHRDLKPENIQICSDGTVKILDYGLSKVIDYSSITQTGQPIGTYFYMSPEQIKGENDITQASDFYSVGVILYELLTSTLLFYPATPAEIIFKTVNVKPPFPSTINSKISNNFENFILKLLEKDSYKRYRTADEVIYDLTNIHKKEAPLPAKIDIKFYVRLIPGDTEVILSYIKKNKIDGSDFPINLHELYKKLRKSLISQNNIDFIADPSTNRLAFTSFKNTKGLAALPYAPSGYDALEPEAFNDIHYLQEFVKQVIDLQIANGCNILTAPFFIFNDTNDAWYRINLKLLKESVAYGKSTYSAYPISGALCTFAETLCKKSQRDKLIDDYANCEIDYLQFFIDKISESSSESHLYNFINTAVSIKKFNNNIKLIGCRLPAIAMGLLTIGFDAITSGLGIIDSFEKSFIVKEEKSGTMPTKFYFPDLLKSVTYSSTNGTVEDIKANETELHKQLPEISFNFTCNCDGCMHDKLTENFQKPRLHFLYIRMSEINEMREIPYDERKGIFIDKIESAYKLQKGLIELGVKLDSPNYLNTWKNILLKF